MGMTGSGKKLPGFDIFFVLSDGSYVFFFLQQSDLVIKKCWVNLRLNQEKRQFFG